MMATKPDKPPAAPSHEWEQLHSQVRERWSELSDADLREAKGNLQELIATIQRKTGEAREQVESFVKGLADAAGDYSADAADSLRRQYDQAAGRLKERYSQAQNSVRSRPTQSIAIAFGAGLLAGFALTSLLSVRRR